MLKFFCNFEITEIIKIRNIEKSGSLSVNSEFIIWEARFTKRK